MNNRLQGKNILITAPHNYARKLSRLLETQSAKVWHYPAIKTFVNPDLESLKTYIAQMPEQAWVMLPSRMAIEAFFKAYELTIKKPLLNSIRLLAFGNDQKFLKSKYQADTFFQPADPGPLGIIDFFKKHTFQGQDILVVVPKVVGVSEPDVIPNFLKDLSQTGLQTHRIEAYITQANRLKDFTAIKAALEDSKIDLIAFTSTAEIMALLNDLSLSELQNIKTACFGPYTGSNAIKLGLQPAYIGQQYTGFEDFVQGIAGLF